MRNRSDPKLGSSLLGFLSPTTGAPPMPTCAFIPLAPQLIARLGAKGDDDDDGRSTLYSGASGRTFTEARFATSPTLTPPDVGMTQPDSDLAGASSAQCDFASLVEQLLEDLCSYDAVDDIVMQLLALLEVEGAEHAGPTPRTLAAERVLARLRAKQPVLVDGLSELTSAYRQLAQREMDAPQPMDASDGGLLSQLHQRVELSVLQVPVGAHSTANGERFRASDAAAPLLASFDSTIQRIPSSGGGVSLRITCYDQAGEKHLQLLKARPRGKLDIGRDALVQQVAAGGASRAAAEGWWLEVGGWERARWRTAIRGDQGRSG